VIPVACNCKPDDEACRHKNCANGLGSINGTPGTGTTATTISPSVFDTKDKDPKTAPAPDVDPSDTQRGNAAH
jgi:hypothetical protein